MANEAIDNDYLPLSRVPEGAKQTALANFDDSYWRHLLRLPSWFWAQRSATACRS